MGRSASADANVRAAFDSQGIRGKLSCLNLRTALAEVADATNPGVGAPYWVASTHSSLIVVQISCPSIDLRFGSVYRRPPTI